MLGIWLVHQSGSLPSRSLKSSEGHRQVNRPLQFRVVRGNAVCCRGAHSRGSLAPVVSSSQDGALGEVRQAKGEMGFSTGRKRWWREYSWQRDSLCKGPWGEDWELSVELEHGDWSRKGRKILEAREVKMGAKPQGFLYITLRNLDFALRTLESWEKVLSRRFSKIALAVVWRLDWRIREKS